MGLERPGLCEEFVATAHSLWRMSRLTAEQEAKVPVYGKCAVAEHATQTPVGALRAGYDTARIRKVSRKTALYSRRALYATLIPVLPQPVSLIPLWYTEYLEGQLSVFSHLNEWARSSFTNSDLGF